MPQKEQKPRVDHLLEQMGLLERRKCKGSTSSCGSKRFLTFPAARFHHPSTCAAVT